MKTEELMKALSLVKPGIGSDMMESKQQTSFAFANGRVTTFNDIISISYPIPDLDICGAVREKELFKFLGKLKTSDITATLTDNELVLKSGRSKVGLALAPEIIIPLHDIENMGPWIELQENFITALKFTSFSCSRDMSRPALAGIHVNIATGVLEARDTYRATRYNLVPISVNAIDGFLIPVQAVDELAKYDVDHIFWDDAWAHFQSKDGLIFSCRIFAEVPQPLDVLLQMPDEPNHLCFCNDLIELLDRAIIFAKRDSKAEEEVRVEVGPLKTRITARGPYGWFDEWTGNKQKATTEIAFDINPSLFKDILERGFTDCQVAEQKIKFFGDCWEHVLALSIWNGPK